jgi:hypothetical protein
MHSSQSPLGLCFLLPQFLQEWIAILVFLFAFFLIAVSGQRRVAPLPFDGLGLVVCSGYINAFAE